MQSNRSGSRDQVNNLVHVNPHTSQKKFGGKDVQTCHFFKDS